LASAPTPAHGLRWDPNTPPELAPAASSTATRPTMLTMLTTTTTTTTTLR
jgi:hypothetical protein